MQKEIIIISNSSSEDEDESPARNDLNRQTRNSEEAQRGGLLPHVVDLTAEDSRSSLCHQPRPNAQPHHAASQVPSLAHHNSVPVAKALKEAAVLLGWPSLPEQLMVMEGVVQQLTLAEYTALRSLFTPLCAASGVDRNCPRIGKLLFF